MEAERVSKQFAEQHVVGFAQALPDGFLDAGRDGSKREELLVDAAADPALREWAALALEVLGPLQPPDQVRWLSLAVCQRFMGPETPALHRKCAEQISALLARQGGSSSRRIPLGRLHYGLCRHRAALFKYVADRAGLQAAMLRGHCNPGGRGEQPHCWNAVRLGGGVFVVDALFAPGQLLPPAEAASEWGLRHWGTPCEGDDIAAPFPICCADPEGPGPCSTALAAALLSRAAAALQHVDTAPAGEALRLARAARAALGAPAEAPPPAPLPREGSVG
eukprot:TRINITY_DN6620_c0_g1_i2.p1 TRINITY_DN6620_c0_g1~~TRINITY_DN6620_c0_g1_i2.p1  ORF type:complete len:300 (+),score=97.04 TRINITY_DN6620_c0_g1_i2:69-902(+)